MKSERKKTDVQEQELEEQAARSAYKADGKYREIERDVAKRWKKGNIRLVVQAFRLIAVFAADLPEF